MPGPTEAELRELIRQRAIREWIIPWMLERNIYVPAAATPAQLLEELTKAWDKKK